MYIAPAVAPDHVPGSSPTEKHQDYLEAINAWTRTRAMLKGADGIKEHADQYIPILPEHLARPDSRRAYVERTPVYPASGRAADSLVSAIFRRDPQVKVPARFDARLDNIDGRGNALYSFSQKVVREVLALGRHGLLIDLPSLDTPANEPPYISSYTAENILNWRSRLINGQYVLDQVVLHEQASTAAEFGSIHRAQYRILELDDSGLYRVRIFQQVASGEVVEIDRIEPTTWGRKRLDRIPFVFLSALDTGPDIKRSPMLDLIDANLDHVKVAADLATSLFKVSSPTLLVVGLDEHTLPSRDVHMGGTIVLPAGASAEMLEFRGDGLGALERQLDRFERHMAHLGARLLEQPKRAAETAETTRLKQHGETSVLASVARTVSNGIRSALEIACQWEGLGGEIAFELNSDFFDATMEPAMLAELMRAVQSGYMPVDDLYWNLKRGELLRPELTVEQYRAEIETDPLIVAGRPDPLALNTAKDDEPEEDDEEDDHEQEDA
jgi:hypothetical protein